MSFAPTRRRAALLTSSTLVVLLIGHRPSVLRADDGLAGLPPEPTIKLRATTLELAAFEGEPAIAVVLLEGDARTALAVSIGAPSGLAVEPARIEIPPGRTATLEVRAAAETPALSGTIKVLVEPRGEGFLASRHELKVRLVRGSFGARALDLGRKRPGETALAAVSHHDVTLEPAVLRGPGGAIALVASGSSVAAAVPETAAAGRYSGTLEVRCGFASRECPVSLEVTPPPRTAPRQLELEARWGWTRTTFELASRARLELEPLVLDGGAARLDPELDMRAQELEAGRYELRVFAAASLPEGRYTGVLTAVVGGESSKIPVTLAVRR